MSQGATRAVAYVLVESGLHAGARLELQEAQTWYSAGGQVDADYWLADPDLTEAKAQFAFVDGGVRVRLLAGPPMVIGAASIEVGAEVAFDNSLLWGGVSFRAAVMPQVQEPAPDVLPKNAPQANVANAMKAVRGLAANRRVMTSLLAMMAVVIPTGIAVSLLGPMLERQHTRERQREALSAQEDPRVRQAQARAAAQRLADLIGMQSVTVTALNGKTLTVFGVNLPSERREAVRAAIAQFEGEFTVHNNISYQAETAPRPARQTHLPEGIDLVQYGPQGYLRGRDGRLYLAGGVLPDGTQVDLIRDREVWLSHGADRAILHANDLGQ